MRDSHDSAKEKHLYLELPVCSSQLFVFKSLLHSPPTPFLYKPVYPSPLFSRIAYGFPTAVPDPSPPLFPKKTIFAGKIMASFIFQDEQNDYFGCNGWNKKYY